MKRVFLYMGDLLSKSLLTVFLLLAGPLVLSAQENRPDTPVKIIPRTKIFQLVLSHKDVEDKPYLSFPCLTRLNEEEVLITFKRGTAHGNDRQADCDMLRFNTATGKVAAHKTLGSIPDRKFQLTLPVRMTNRDIRFYTDLQHTGPDRRHYRNGILFTKSSDGGETADPWEKMDPVGGVEYGYPLDFIVEDKVVYMLAMSFGYRPGGIWSVAGLKSEDGAKSWKLVRNITEALGDSPINESSFARAGEGFVVVSRGYYQPTKIARFDDNFNLLDVKDLTGTGILRDYIGWPRVFTRDGRLYVLGRMWVQRPESRIRDRSRHSPALDDYMQLVMLRMDTSDLTIEKIVLLDNEDANLPVTDGYYAAPYWMEKDGETWFNTITYRAMERNYPDIVRLAFRWDELK